MTPAIAMDLGLAPEITITKRDLGRLKNMIGNYAPIISWKAAGFLLRELDRARVVDAEAIAPTTVTMDSKVEFQDATIGDVSVVTLAFSKRTGALPRLDLGPDGPRNGVARSLQGTVDQLHRQGRSGENDHGAEHPLPARRGKMVPPKASGMTR